MVISGSSFSKQTGFKVTCLCEKLVESTSLKSRRHRFAYTVPADSRKQKMCAVNNFMVVVSRWLRRPRHVTHARAESKIWNRGCAYRPRPSFTFHKAPTNSRAVCPSALRNYIYSKRGACIRRAAKTHRPIQPFQAIAIIAVARELARRSAPGVTVMRILKWYRRVGTLAPRPPACDRLTGERCVPE